ncbi:MAG: 50S ribosomal protein L29 [Gemmatimonadota bacterium]
MNATDIREMTDAEIQERIEESKEELFRLRYRSATQQLENPLLLRILRRDVARMRTILREREMTNNG